MRRLLAAVGLVLLSVVPASAEIMNVEDYLAIRRGDNADVSTDDLNRYLSGVLDGVISYGTLMQERGSPLFCLPDDPANRISVDNLEEALDEMFQQFQRDMDDFEERAARNSMGLATMQLFVFRFPCEEGDGG